MKSRSFIILVIFLGLFVSLMTVTHRWENYRINFEKSGDKKISLTLGHAPDRKTSDMEAKEECKKSIAYHKNTDTHPKKHGGFYHWLASLLHNDSPGQGMFSFTISSGF
jgi:hypothetical protein